MLIGKNWEKMEGEDGIIAKDKPIEKTGGRRSFVGGGNTSRTCLLARPSCLGFYEVQVANPQSISEKVEFSEYTAQADCRDSSINLPMGSLFFR